MPAYKDSKTGKWFAKFQIETLDGKKRQHIKRGFAKKADALAYEHEKKAEKSHLPSITLQTLCVRFLDDYSINHRENSLRLIRANLTRHILPYLGEIKLNELSAIKIREWQKIINKKPLAASTKNSINTTLKTLLKFAVKYYGFSHDILAGVSPLGRIETKKKIITLDEWKRLDDVIEDKHYKALFNLLFWCGLRIGEVMALQLLDFDFIAGSIRIEKQYNSDAKTTAPLKTVSSRRIVAIPPSVMEVVKEYLTAYYEVPEFPFAIKTARGINWKLKYYCEKANIPVISAHALRHSHASLLINEKIPAPVISDRLGHSNTYTTLKIYAHAYANADNQLAGFLDTMNK